MTWVITLNQSCPPLAAHLQALHSAQAPHDLLECIYTKWAQTQTCLRIHLSVHCTDIYTSGNCKQLCDSTADFRLQWALNDNWTWVTGSWAWMQLYDSSNMTGYVYDKGDRFMLSKKLGRWILFLLVLAIIKCDRARNMSSQRDQTDYKLKKQSWAKQEWK